MGGRLGVLVFAVLVVAGLAAGSVPAGGQVYHSYSRALEYLASVGGGSGFPAILPASDAAVVFEALSSCAGGGLAEAASRLAGELASDSPRPPVVNDLLDDAAQALYAASLRGGLAGCNVTVAFKAAMLAYSYFSAGSVLLRLDPSTESVAGRVWLAERVYGEYDRVVYTAVLASVRASSLPEDAFRSSASTASHARLLGLLLGPDGSPVPEAVALLAAMGAADHDPESVVEAARLAGGRAGVLAALLYNGPEACRALSMLLTGQEEAPLDAAVSMAFSGGEWRRPLEWRAERLAAYKLILSCSVEDPVYASWLSLARGLQPWEARVYTGEGGLGNADLSLVTYRVASSGPGDRLLPMPPMCSLALTGRLQQWVSALDYYAGRAGPVESYLAGTLASMLSDAVHDCRSVGLSVLGLASGAGMYASALLAVLVDEHARGGGFDGFDASLAGVLISVAEAAVATNPKAPVDPLTLARALQLAGEPVPGDVVDALAAGDFQRALDSLARAGGDRHTQALAVAVWSTMTYHAVAPQGGVDSYTQYLPPGEWPTPSSLDDLLQALNTTVNETDPQALIDAIAAASRIAASPGPGAEYYHAGLARAYADALTALTGQQPRGWAANPYATEPQPAPVEEAGWEPPLDPDTARTLAFTAQDYALGEGDPRAQVLADMLWAYAAAVEKGDAAAAEELFEEIARFIEANPDILQALAQQAPDAVPPSLLEELRGQARGGVWGSGAAPAGGVAREGDLDSLARLLEDLAEQGRIEEAARILDSLPEDYRESLLEKIGDLGDLASSLGAGPGGPSLPDIPLEAPSLDAPSLSLPGAPGLGVPSPSTLLPLLALLAVAAALLAARRASLALRQAPARRALRRLEELQAPGAGGPRDLREAIIEAYASLLEALARTHRPKAGWETHREYDASLPDELRRLHTEPARAFELAKFSRRPVTERELEVVAAALRALAESRRRGAAGGGGGA